MLWFLKFKHYLTVFLYNKPFDKIFEVLSEKRSDRIHFEQTFFKDVRDIDEKRVDEWF